MMTRMICAAAMVAALAGCTRSPDTRYQNTRTFRFSDHTVRVTLPSDAPANSDPEDIDIENEEPFAEYPYGELEVVTDFWHWDTPMKVLGDLNIWMDVLLLNEDEDLTTHTLPSAIEAWERRTEQVPLPASPNEPRTPSGPIASKVVVTFGDSPVHWLLYKHAGADSKLEPLDPDSKYAKLNSSTHTGRSFAYPLDSRHLLNIVITIDGSDSNTRWRAEAEALADAIMSSVQIETAGDVSKVDYGAVDIGDATGIAWQP